MSSNEFPYRAHFVRMSGNTKTGYIPVTTSERATCPDSCSLKNNGCYHEYRNLVGLWRKIDRGDVGCSWEELCNHIRALPKFQLWRHNVGGDLPGLSDHLDHHALAMLVEANKGRRGFTFSHKPVLNNLRNAQAIYAANKQGFTINLSADYIEQADELVALGAGPVVSLVEQDYPHKPSKSPAGNTLVVCPAVMRKEITCATCGLCAVADRKSIVVFPAHGTRKKHVSQLVRLRRHKNDDVIRLAA